MAFSVFLVQTRFYERWLLWPQGATISSKMYPGLSASLPSLWEREACDPFDLLLPAARHEGEVRLVCKSCLVPFQVVEFCNEGTHNREAPNLQNRVCSLRSTWDVITDSSDLNHSLPVLGAELPAPPTFSLLQAGDRVVCLVIDVSRKMAEVNADSKWLKTLPPYWVLTLFIHRMMGWQEWGAQRVLKSPRHLIFLRSR